VAVRGEDRFAILDVQAAIKASGGAAVQAVRMYLPTINGPAQYGSLRTAAWRSSPARRYPGLTSSRSGRTRRDIRSPSASSLWTSARQTSRPSHRS